MDGAGTHDLLLALAGRVDDDLLAWARELVAVGEDTRAVELVTAGLVVDRVALPEAVRAAVVAAVRATRGQIDADTALPPAGPEDGLEHRFDPSAPRDDVRHALLGVPARRLRDCRVYLTWRLTPAGTAPGPLPHPVVLVEVEPGARPADVLAYQLAVTLERVGVQASVEVLTGPRSAYHAAALRGATLVRAEVAEPAPLPDTAASTAHGPDADLLGAPSRFPQPAWLGATELSRTAPRTSILRNSFPGPDDTPTPPGGTPADVTSTPDADERPEHIPPAQPLPTAQPLPAPRPVRQMPIPGGRRRSPSPDSNGELSPPRPLARPAPNPSGAPTSRAPLARRVRPPAGGGRPLPVPAADASQTVFDDDSRRPPAPGISRTGGDDLFAPSDPLNGPIGQPLLEPLLEPTIPTGAPMVRIDQELEPADAASGADEESTAGPRTTDPEAIDPEPSGNRTTAPSANGYPNPGQGDPALPASDPEPDAWTSEWASGDWAMPSSDVAPQSPPVHPDYSARHRSGDPAPGIRPLPNQEPPSPQPDPLDADPGADPGAEPDDPGPLPDLGLRPESMARLSDNDRELLARLQAELVAGRRPRVSRRAGVGGNGSGPHPPADPPNLPG